MLSVHLELGRGALKQVEITSDCVETKEEGSALSSSSDARSLIISFCWTISIKGLATQISVRWKFDFFYKQFRPSITNPTEQDHIKSL